MTNFMGIEGALLALLILSLGACFVLVGSLFVNAKSAPSFAFTGSVVTILLALAVFVSSRDAVLTGASLSSISLGALHSDEFGFFTGFLILLSALFSALLSGSYLESEGVTNSTEYWFLLLAATAGGLVLALASDFITLFLGLEILSISAYCLTASTRKKKSATEAALKYLLLGCFSTAVLCYGFVFLYGATGSISLASPVWNFGSQALDASFAGPLSLVLILVAFAFKLGAPPFHFWVPDVYQAAPAPATAFMSCVVKAASFAALIRLLVSTYAPFASSIMWLVWLFAVLAMFVGNVIAVRQRSVKRMLAYSSIAHTGYMLAALASGLTFDANLSALLFYLFIYCLTSLGAFAVVAAVGTDSGGEEGLTRWSGLGSTKPHLAWCMTVFLLSLAGLPPGIAGLLSKVFIIQGTIQNGFWGLGVLILINSAISCFYYLRVIVSMFFVPAEDSGRDFHDSVGVGAGGVIVACLFAALALGVFPEPVMKAGRVAAASLGAAIKP